MGPYIVDALVHITSNAALDLACAAIDPVECAVGTFAQVGAVAAVFAPPLFICIAVTIARLSAVCARVPAILRLALRAAIGLLRRTFLCSRRRAAVLAISLAVAIALCRNAARGGKGKGGGSQHQMSHLLNSIYPTQRASRPAVPRQ